MKQYAKAKAFYEEYGHLSLLPKHQVELLNEIGMNWDNIETVRAEQFWEDMYLVSQKHFESHGNLKVGAQYVTEDGVKLGQWLAQQRRIRRGTLKHSIELNEDRIGRLDALGMVWEHKIISWDEYYMALLEYVAEHGTARVLSGYVNSEGVKLGSWVQHQRGEYRNGRLSADRIEKLNQINFIWNVEEDRWRQNYGAVKRYYEEHGNCSIPQDMKNEYGESIYVWLGRVRRGCMSDDVCKLSEEQKKMLMDINVVKK